MTILHFGVFEVSGSFPNIDSGGQPFSTILYGWSVWSALTCYRAKDGTCGRGRALHFAARLVVPTLTASLLSISGQEQPHLVHSAPLPSPRRTRFSKFVRARIRMCRPTTHLTCVDVQRSIYSIFRSFWWKNSEPPEMRRRICCSQYSDLVHILIAFLGITVIIFANFVM